MSWSNFVNRYKTATKLSLNVTRHELFLGDQDSETGCYLTSYAESIIEMIVILKEAYQVQLSFGLFVRNDALGLTQATAYEGDKIETASGKIYEIVSVTPKEELGTRLSHKQCELHELPLQSSVLEEYELGMI